MTSDTTRLPDDRACICCGHNLRGLHSGGTCGECGFPVRDSLNGLLLGQGPEWAERARGAAILMLILLPWLWISFVHIAWGYAAFRLARPSRMRPRDRWSLAWTSFSLLLAIATPLLFWAALSTRSLPISERAADALATALYALIAGLVLWFPSLTVGGWIRDRPQSWTLRLSQWNTALAMAIAAGGSLLAYGEYRNEDAFRISGWIAIVTAGTISPVTLSLLLLRVLQVTAIETTGGKDERRYWVSLPGGGNPQGAAADTGQTGFQV